jgi:DNA-binding GntR family transcriptional regulator
MELAKPKKVHSLTEQAHQSIKRYILTKESVREERLTEEFFSRELGISKSPIREAMNSLEREGLLRIEPRRGAFVRTFSVKEISDLYNVREIIEVYAAEHAVLTDEFIAELRASVQRIADYHSQGNKEAFIDEDVVFHSMIVQAAGNEELLRLHANTQDKQWLCRCQTFQLVSPDSPKAHSAIAEGLAAGDRAAAVEATRSHIRFVSAALQRAQLAKAEK